MDEVYFKRYCLENGISSKVTSDMISRLKRVEKILDIDLDTEYENDECTSLLEQFSINNAEKKVLLDGIQINSHVNYTFRYAIKKYVLFCESNEEKFL